MDLDMPITDLDPVHYLGIILALISAGIHFYLAPSIGGYTGISFVLAGLGFLVGIVAILLDYRRRLFYLLGIPFIVAQIVLWWQINRITLEGLIAAGLTLGLVDKISQIILVLVLLFLYLRED